MPTDSKESRHKLLDIINEKLAENGVTDVPEDEIFELTVYAKDAKTGNDVVDIARTSMAVMDKFLGDEKLQQLQLTRKSK